MISDSGKLKAAVRAEMRAAVAALPLESRRQAALDLCAHLDRSEIWRMANVVLLFAPMADEPDIWPLLAKALGEGKTVGLPRFSPERGHYVAGQICDPTRDLQPGKFQVREPVAACAEILLGRFDLVLVPGVAFDRAGWRLGRGKGFYDRLLAEVRGVKCGVAFAEQMVAIIPTEAHDTRVDFVVTPRGLIKAETKS